ncbi:MAG: hypothetical protein WA188_14405 [Terriglobales bacterium]
MACDTQVVKIHQDGTVDTEKCALSKRAKHRILWISESDRAYKVRFTEKGSPFGDSEFAVPPGGWAESREIREDAKVDTYPYDTYVPGTGEVAADPGVIIQE